MEKQEPTPSDTDSVHVNSHAQAPFWLEVAVDIPLGAHLTHLSEHGYTQGFDFSWRKEDDVFTDAATGEILPITPLRGSLVVVPWGKAVGDKALRVGVVLAILPAPRMDAAKIRPARLMRHPQTGLVLPPLPAQSLTLAAFAADYYHRSLGEVLMPALAVRAVLPKRIMPVKALKSAKKPLQTSDDLSPENATVDNSTAPKFAPKFALTTQQAAAVAAVQAASVKEKEKGFSAQVLHGVTGSGKTEVYLALAAAQILAGKQVLILVPEIILVAGMVARVEDRLKASPLQNARVVQLHSGLTDGQRRAAWQATLLGDVDVVVGTRLSVFAPLSRLGLIVIDEEHDPSYKQQEGVRYSARDLSLRLAQLWACPVILGSATPSLESWHNAKTGKYGLLRLTERAHTAAKLPSIELIDMRVKKENDKPHKDPQKELAKKNLPTFAGLSPQAAQALQETLAAGQQSLVFLNRRGYAPVLACDACGWASECPNCSAHAALHRAGDRWRLVCHHCGYHVAVPRACPDCGNVDIKPEGQGTQRIEETLAAALPHARIARLDGDTARKAGAAPEIAAQMAAGEIDILIGTQMTAKGHNFPNLATVLVVGADGVLTSPDFRGTERLFALLMQVSGRAGRATVAGRVLVQTKYPEHPVFQALIRHDVIGFYDYLLAERREAGLPPMGYQAAIRAAHKDQVLAMEWLHSVKAIIQAENADIAVFAPVPMLMSKVANVHRVQLLLESPSRVALQSCLRAVMPALADSAAAAKRMVWHLEIDPVDV